MFGLVVVNMRLEDTPAVWCFIYFRGLPESVGSSPTRLGTFDQKYFVYAEDARRDMLLNLLEF